MVLAGTLSTEQLRATVARQKARDQRNKGLNKIIQKYSEIYSHQAHRQITEDKEEEREVINIQE